MTPADGRITVMLLGPQRSVVGGVSTHINLLMASTLSDRFTLVHFEVGSRGRVSPARDEKLGSMMWRVIWSPVALAARIMALRVAVIHINTSLVPKSFWRDLAYLLIAKLLNRKVIYQVHGGSLSEFRSKEKFAAWLFKWIIRIPDAVVVISVLERDNFRKFAQVRRLVVIPNAIDLDEYGDIRPKNYSAAIIQLVFLGRVDMDKGLMEAVEAVRILVKEQGIHDLKFLIAGSGPAEAVLRSKIDEYELARHVELVGPVFGRDKVNFWRDAELLIFPSYHEGLPYTILESLASATPVVATNVGGIPEAVKDGIHGILVKPRNAVVLADAIKRLVCNRPRLRKMSEECVKRARECYRIDRLAREFTVLYEDVLVDYSQRNMQKIKKVK